MNAIIAAAVAWSIFCGSTAQAGSLSFRSHSVSGFSAEAIATSVSEAARRFDIPEGWINAVMRVESGGDWRARSSKGAIGLMQIMPETWRDLHARYDLGADPFDPHDNILAGAAYLRQLYGRYGMPGFLAAYNAGPGRYERHLATGRPLPDETRAYVAKLSSVAEAEQTERQMTVFRTSVQSIAMLFVSRSAQHSPDVRRAFGKPPNRSLCAARVIDLSAFPPHSNSLFARHRHGNLWRSSTQPSSWPVADHRMLEGEDVRPGKLGHGLRDKSADGRRAHVVGWIRVSGVIEVSPAGGSRRKRSQISSTSAVSRVSISPRSP
ncbi:lytic transglycosylase domain-containing protein [Bradyrhizobium sp. SZCCHNRI20481]|uniref:lytic transglycosylase domain-containing protein n=1 Tax=Bradyrhizobium sp. SZCCHNRI20481 TaxID=3057286 RepID=UPI002915DECA|nr:lytic transglycosylase domain-containing protein [Bradyrhizobium sp. SZCCHNRI20481]